MHLVDLVMNSAPSEMWQKRLCMYTNSGALLPSKVSGMEFWKCERTNELLYIAALGLFRTLKMAHANDKAISLRRWKLSQIFIGDTPLICSSWSKLCDDISFGWWRHQNDSLISYLTIPVFLT